MTAWEPQDSSSDETVPGLPPKVLDQLGDKIHDKSSDLKTIFSFSAWPGKKTLLVALVGGLVILIAIVAVLVGLMGQRTTEQKNVNGEYASSDLGRQEPLADGTLPGQRHLPPPRISVPLPQPEAESAERKNLITRKRAAGLLNKTFSEDIKKGKNHLKPYIAKAGLAMIDPIFTLSIDELTLLTPQERAYIAAYYDMFTQLGRNLGSKLNEDADLIYLSTAAERLSDQLNAQQSMKITKLLLCQNITGFGKYEESPNLVFSIHQLPLVQVYIEIANLKSEPGPDNQYVIRISKDIRLISQSMSGEEVVMQTAMSATEVSRSIRRDFYISQPLNPPRDLKSGDYLLEVRINDKVSGETATASVPLTVIND